MYRRRIKQWNREIALAVILTLAAAAFIGAALLRDGEGTPRLASGPGKDAAR